MFLVLRAQQVRHVATQDPRAGSPASGLLLALGGRTAEIDPPGGLASFFGRPRGRFAPGPCLFRRILFKILSFRLLVLRASLVGVLLLLHLFFVDVFLCRCFTRGTRKTSNDANPT